MQKTGAKQLQQHKSKFQQEHPLEKRSAESAKVRVKYPDRIPVICEKGAGTIPSIEKIKYLVPSRITLGEFAWVIRKRFSLNETTAIILHVNKVAPPINQLMGNLYEDHKDEDGFLYITYSNENCFG